MRKNLIVPINDNASPAGKSTFCELTHERPISVHLFLLIFPQQQTLGIGNV